MSNKTVIETLRTLDAACAAFHKDLIRMMVTDDKGFILYVLGIFLACEVIHSCIVM